MKVTKKIIILLFFIIGILVMGISKVEAAESEWYLKENGDKVSFKNLRGTKENARHSVYHIGYSEFKKFSNLFCVEHTQKLRRKGAKYKLIKQVKIENREAFIIKKDGSEGDNVVVDDLNLKLAYGLSSLDDKEERQEFLWGFTKTWIKDIGHPHFNISYDFATAVKGEDSDTVNKKVNKQVKHLELAQNELTVDSGEVEMITRLIDNRQYYIFGPYVAEGIPAKNGLDKLEILDQNNKPISDYKLAVYDSEEKLNIIEKKKIRNGKGFYICIPTDTKISKFKADLTAKKKTTDTVKAELWFFECPIDNWQNLVVADWSIDSNGGEDVSVSTNWMDIPGKLKFGIKKKNSLNGDPLGGVEFAVFQFFTKSTGHHAAIYENGTNSLRNYYYFTDEEIIKDQKGNHIGVNVDLASKGMPNCHVGEWYTRYYAVKGSSGWELKEMSINTARTTSGGTHKTNSAGEINLDGLPKNGGLYFGVEVEAPRGYNKCYTGFGTDSFFEISSNPELEYVKEIGNTPKTESNLRLIKVVENHPDVPIQGVEFRFHNSKYGWLRGSKNAYSYTWKEDEATKYKTDENGQINLEGLVSDGIWSHHEVEETLPYGFRLSDEDNNTFTLLDSGTTEIVVQNPQEYVRLSGFVWVDQPGDKSRDKKNNNNHFKEKTQPFDDNEDLLFDGIPVRLKNTDGQVVQQVVTKQCDRYTEDGHNGHGEYVFEDVAIDDLDKLYIEFEYDGLTYENVLPYNNSEVQKYNKPDKASKAAESTRQGFNNGFSVVEGKKDDPTHGQTRDTGDNVKHQLDYNLNNDDNDDKKYTSTLTSQRTI